MTNCICTPPCSRIALMVAMETMHFFHSAKEFIFEDKNSLHFWGPNERFGTHEKLSWGCKVGQISSRDISDINHVNRNGRDIRKTCP